MEEAEALPIGKVKFSGTATTSSVDGSMVYPAMQVAEILSDGLNATVVNARFAKPLDTELTLAQRIGRVVTLEEGCLMGGFGSAVASTARCGCRRASKRIGVPDVLVDHAEPDQSKAAFGLTSPQMAEQVLAFFKPQLSTVNY